jgi:hypothetical protein
MDGLAGLVLLACPVGMGLMMWMMMRGHGKDGGGDRSVTAAEIERLRAEVGQLRADRDGSAEANDASTHRRQ